MSKRQATKRQRRGSIPVEEWFWSKVDKRGSTECWEWTARCEQGYGIFWEKGRHVKAHRFAYGLLVGPVLDGLTLDHLCRNRRCVNPAHLEPISNRENILRGNGPPAVNARKTHCPQGHPYTPENTYIQKNQGGWRMCLTCMRARDTGISRKRKERRKNR